MYRIMTITNLEEQVFKKWGESRKGFVKDGVISEQDYLNSDTKIAIILKEANDKAGGGWDLRKFLAEGGRSQSWDNVARWVHGINNRNSTPDWNFYSKITNEFRIETFKHISVINLKKSPGTATTV